MAIVRANQSVVVTLDGAPQTVKEGDAHDSSDAIVRLFPWLFGDDVEEATARPGERRTARRPS